MAIKGAGGKIRAQDGTPHAMGDPNPNGGQTVMSAHFPMRTDRRKGRQENVDLRNELGSASGNRERNSTIAGT